MKTLRIFEEEVNEKMGVDSDAHVDLIKGEEFNLLKILVEFNDKRMIDFYQRVKQETNELPNNHKLKAYCLGELAKISARREGGIAEAEQLINRSHELLNQRSAGIAFVNLLNAQLEIAFICKTWIGPSFQESVSKLKYKKDKVEQFLILENLLKSATLQQVGRVIG